jgi:hypothetical protein
MEQIAAYERVSNQQIVLGDILGALGTYLGSQGGPGGEFIYSTPGYLALVTQPRTSAVLGSPFRSIKTIRMICQSSPPAWATELVLFTLSIRTIRQVLSTTMLPSNRFYGRSRSEFR